MIERIVPPDVEEILRRGEALFSEGRVPEAVELFANAVRLAPENTRCLNDLGVASFHLGDFDMAEEFLVKALRLNRREPDALQNLQGVYSRREPEKAERLRRLMGREENRPFETSSRIPPSKRILVINNLFPPQELGGYGRVMADYVSILRNRGHHVHVLTSDTRYLGEPGSGPGVERTLLLFGEWSSKGMEEYDREMILSTLRRNDSVIRETLDRIRPDLCLVGNIDLLSAFVFQPLFERDIPVLHRMGNEFIGYPVPDAPTNPLYHVATPSHWLKEDAVRRGYPFHDAFLIPSGAFVREFEMVFPPATDRLRIAYAGLVNGYKGPQVLIEALEMLDRRGVDFSCSMAGGTFDEEFAAGLKETVSDLGLGEKVRFTGFLSREELKDLYARHNVLVFPSLVNETFGISQVEAMAAGLLVITSGTGGAREVVKDGESGLWFEPGNSTQLAVLLEDLTKDRYRWENIAAQGRKRALEQFDIEKSVDLIEKAFAEMLLGTTYRILSVVRSPLR